MKSIDLTQFATYSQKLPGAFLRPAETKKVPTRKLLSAHFADFMLCVAATSFMAQVYNLSIKGLLVTQSLRGAFAGAETARLAMSLLPLTVCSYFFLSYFMNDGQTWGMHLFKTRLEMTSRSFKEAFVWSIKSMLLCFTGGLYFAFGKSQWEKNQAHDYLYQNLLVHRDIQPVNLLQKIEEFHSEEELEVFDQAA